MKNDSEGSPAGWSAGLTDDELLAELSRALTATGPVPARVVEAGKAAWTWRSIDAELAELINDSEIGPLAADDPDREPVGAGATRAEQAVLRSLSFVADDLIIELEVTAESVLGQLVPARAATVTLQTCDLDDVGSPVDGTARVVVDEVGWFRLSPVPARRFRLSCSTADGRTVVTGWISL